MRLRTAAALAALPLLLPTLAAPAQAGRRFSLAGDDVVIWDPAGRVEIRATFASSVKVEVSAMGRDASELSFSDEPIGGHPTLRVLYPHTTVVYPPMGRWSNSGTEIRSDGTWGSGHKSMNLFGRRFTVKGMGSGTEAWADLVIGVPRGRRISV